MKTVIEQMYVCCMKCAYYCPFCQWLIVPVLLYWIGVNEITNALLFNVRHHTSVLIVVVYFHGMGLADNSMHASPNSWHGLGNVDTVDNTGQTGNISRFSRSINSWHTSNVSLCKKWNSHKLGLLSVYLRNIKVKVKQSLYSFAQALKVSGSWGFQI